MLSFHAPAMAEHYDEYPQMIVRWNGQQVGVAREMTRRSLTYRWDFCLLSERSPVALAPTLMSLAGKIEDFITTWEAHESTYDGLAEARALPHLMDPMH